MPLVQPTKIPNRHIKIERVQVQKKLFYSNFCVWTSTHKDQFSIVQQNGKMKRLAIGATSLVFWCHVSSSTQAIFDIFVQRFCYTHTDTHISIYSFRPPHIHTQITSLFLQSAPSERVTVSEIHFCFNSFLSFKISYSISVVCCPCHF